MPYFFQCESDSKIGSNVDLQLPVGLVVGWTPLTRLEAVDSEKCNNFNVNFVGSNLKVET